MQKKVLTIALALGLVLNYLASNETKSKLSEANLPSTSKALCFTENKGQVTDQNHQARPDVLFGGQSNGLAFHLRNNGISYQLNRIDKWKTDKLDATLKSKKATQQKQIEKSTVYRVDINWLNANKNATILKDQELQGYSNYFVTNNQVTVKSYGQIIYQNLYKDIDLKWYEKDGELKYDYLCAAGADYKKIKLQIEGAQQLSINSKGELEITTPLGTITEKAPVVLQGGAQLISKWDLTTNILSFKIENLNKQLPFVIDPAVRAWGTYYGGNSFESANAVATHTNGDVYIAGGTYLNTSTIIATSGSHQSILGGLDDAFLVKFNSSGVRQWSTYYGGSDSDVGRSCAVDASGNVYISGITSSTNGIATPGAHQSAIGGGNMADAFLVKFNSSGVRQWGTYYGGNSVDESHQCALDPAGNIYLSGTTELTTSTVIATTGAVHQSTFGGGSNDAFLVKFNSSGVRQWATYYGGTNIDFGFSCSADASSVYMAGSTSSTNSAMVSVGCHQSTNGGSLYDGYVVKFNNTTGARIWASFYGGSDIDQAYGCSADALGNVYVCGVSNSSLTNVIATAAAHQTIGATTSDDDAFLVKFNNTGFRQWGTYYGGDGFDVGNKCIVDATNNVYLVGSTTSTLGSAIATAGSHQTVVGSLVGGINAFFAKFNSGGVRQWGTYYGEDAEEGNSCSINTNGEMYMCGLSTTPSSTVVSTVGSHQVNLGGITDAFLVKFLDCIATPPTSATSVSNQAICAGNTTTLSATSGTNTINWYATPTSTTILGTGNNYTTPTLSTGTYTYYAEASSICGASLRTGITLTVNPGPTISVNSGTVCSGSTFTIQASGANTYTYQGGSNTVTPTSNSTYTVIGQNAAGCLAQNVATCNITVLATPSISASNGSVCSGQSFTIVPSGAVSYSLINSSGDPYTSNMVVAPITTTLYGVSGTGSNGCISSLFGGSAIVNVTVTSANIAVNSGTICSGNSFTIVPSGGLTYTYQGGSNIVNPTISSQYTVAGIDNTGCTGFATATVVIETSPTISVNSGTICLGQSFTIVPIGGSSYTIQGGNAVVSPTISTNYTVTGRSSAGCVVANDVTCTVIVKEGPRMPFPNILTGSDNAYYLGDSYIIKPNYDLEDYFVELVPNKKPLTLDEADNDLNELKVSYYIGPPLISTLTIIDYKNTGCKSTFTIQLNESEDLSKYWVFPDFISPNEDGKNDNWVPTYKGRTWSPNAYENTNLSDDQHLALGKIFIYSVTIIKFPNKEILFKSDLVQPIDWIADQQGFTTPFFAVYIIQFINGKKTSGLITVDPTSKTK